MQRAVPLERNYPTRRYVSPTVDLRKLDSNSKHLGTFHIMQNKPAHEEEYTNALPGT